MSIILGCIADDLTGATDLGLTLSRGGMRVVQIMGAPRPADIPDDADAIVVALKSRTIPAEDAVAQSLASAKALLGAGATRLFFKYCSTFDSTDAGNIGPVADALGMLRTCERSTQQALGRRKLAGSRRPVARGLRFPARGAVFERPGELRGRCRRRVCRPMSPFRRRSAGTSLDRRTSRTCFQLNVSIIFTRNQTVVV